MITEQFVAKMEEIVGASHVSRTAADLELYSYDASLVSGKPGLIVFPATTEEVSEILREADQAGVESVARGFATNLSGGTIIKGGMVISLSRFNRILGVYPESRYAVLQPGVTNIELQEALAPLGAFYAPDPASQKVSTLGGNVGENSGGPRCLKYGVTSNHILGMQMVMADGEIVQIGGPVLDPAGYDLRGLVVGGEGGLGVTTEITVRVTPMTESVITMLAVYDDMSYAAETVSEIITTGIVPNTLEMIDNQVILAVEKAGPCGYPTDAAAVLLIEVEGMELGLQAQADTIYDICMATKCREVRVAKDQAERDLLWQGRRSAFGAVCNLAPNYLVNDGCVVRTKLPEMLERVKEISDKYGCPVGNVFHAGDGNLHPLLMFDSRKEGELDRVHKAGWEIMEACAEFDGTISGEHGIGHEKQEAMTMIFSGHDLNTQQDVKLALDPKNLLNPGKVIPVPPDGEKRLPQSEPTILKRPGGKSAAGVAEAIETIRQARSEKKAVKLSGAGTFNGTGNLSESGIPTVDSLKMSDIIEYDSENQFIVVGSGVSFTTVQEKLGENNQWLPLRPSFFQENSTIGSLVAMGSSGPERVAYGAPRDLLLGLQYIDSSGSMVAAGGKVVKNVAGYDMTRLMTGSSGTLGFITESTWKVVTRPQACKMTGSYGTLEDCFAAALKVINSNMLPVFVTAVPENAAWKMMVGFEGIGDVVAHQIKRCDQVMSDQGLVDIFQEEYPVLEGCFHENFQQLSSSPFICQADTVIARMRECYTDIVKICKPSQTFLDFACGRIYVGLDALADDKWFELNSIFVRYQGNGRVIKATDDFREKNDVYGQERDEWRLSHQIKKVLDPENIFSPGALPGRV